jgi:hypothetical protein
MPNFNWDFNVATMLTVAAGIASFYFGTRNDLKNLKDVLAQGMGKLDQNVEKMNSVVMELALSTQRQDNFEKRTDDRFKHLEDDLRELKHGDGIILPKPPASLRGQ